MTSTARSEATFSSSGKLESQAASAALYATRESPTKSKSHPLLDEDGKLSSAGAATSLKYARAQDLPSFPSSGLKLSSAGAAASLADSNKKAFEHWQPGSIPAANKAADLAIDYQMNPLWHPEASKAGNSAAGQALKMKPVGAITERESPADSRKKALIAATASMAGSRRRADSAPLAPQKDNSWALKAARGSQKPPGDRPFASGDPGFEAARIQNMSQSNISRQMYGSAPPVALEVEERNRQAVLKASAVAMARKMYAMQQQHIDEARAAKRSEGTSGATSAHNRERSNTSNSIDDETASTTRFQGLEEAAKKLAMERLAKLHDEHAEYRQYYGPTTPAKARTSFRPRRGRASSDSQQMIDSDEEKSQKIRSQMSMFQSELAAVDTQKRQSDRDAVMAAAYKNVTKNMAEMDEKVFRDTGKQTPHMKILWEKEARDRAQSNSDNRMLNHGKVHIGGGRYMDQSEIDAIARARLQPTLDEISEKAETQRARDEEIRIEEERKKRELEVEKTRQAQIKAEERVEAQRTKAEEKARKDEVKRVQKEEAATRKENARAEAAAEKERLNAEKEENRTPNEKKASRFGKLLGTTGAGAAAVGGGAAVLGEESAAADDRFVPDPDDEGEVVTPHPEAVEDDETEDKPEDEAAYHHLSTTTPAVEEEDKFGTSAEGEKELTSPASPTSPTPAENAAVTSPVARSKSGSKVKTWLKTRFRSGSKSEVDPPSVPYDSTKPVGPGEAIDEEKETDSMRDVAMAGKMETGETEDMYGTSDHEVSPVKDENVQGNGTAEIAGDGSSVSSASLYSKEVGKQNPVSAPVDEARSTSSSEPSRGRRGFKERIMSKIGSPKEAKSGLRPPPTNVNGDDDEVEEARDTFEEARSAPPIPSAAVDDSSKALSPKASKDGSKFKEDL